MNCNQARAMLSAYRELKRERIDTVDLEAHLEGCAACREVLASYTNVSEQVRSAFDCAPAPDMHARLMKALADEQLKILQKSAPGTVPTPEFLKPHLQERAEEAQGRDKIAAFSTAETGPLPVIQSRRKPRPVHGNQFAVLGLAAAALLLLMMGGLTSLLTIARNNPNTIVRTSNSVFRPTEVDQKIYTSTTLYPNVTSALPSGNFVYYTASGSTDLDGSEWMLMQLDRSTQISTPLLEAPVNTPLILLAASNNWLVWLEYSRSQPLGHGHLPANTGSYTPQRLWSLHYLSLLPQSQNVTGAQATDRDALTGPKKTSQTTPAEVPGNQAGQANVPASTLLEQGVFDSTTAPDWVNSPIQGTWLIGDTLLITQVDQQGISHLDRYLLGQTGKAAQEIARASAGHVLIWPTADNTGMDIYWADEWIGVDGLLHSNIWQQQTTERATRSHGYAENVDSNTQQVLFGDGMSFQPQVVDNTLFWLSTSEIKVSEQGGISPNGTPLPTSAMDTSVVLTPRTDVGVYPAPPDALVHGTIFMIPLDGPEVGLENTLGIVGQSTGFQAGGDYVIWQDNTGYQMYDVLHQSNVITGDTLNAASLLVVNGDTTLWLSANATSSSDSQLTMMAFNWSN